MSLSTYTASPFASGSVGGAHAGAAHGEERFDAAAVLAAGRSFGVTRLALALPALLAIVRAASTAARVATLKGVA